MFAQKFVGLCASFFTISHARICPLAPDHFFSSVSILFFFFFSQRELCRLRKSPNVFANKQEKVEASAGIENTDICSTTATIARVLKRKKKEIEKRGAKRRRASSDSRVIKKRVCGNRRSYMLYTASSGFIAGEEGLWPRIKRNRKAKRVAEG